MKKPGIAAMLILICALLFIPILPAWAYPAPPLPDDNLIVNPWFRSAEDPHKAGLDGWTNELTDGVGWGISQKVDNPSPEILVSGDCAFEPVYCGTGARWAEERLDGEKMTYPGLDVYLHQVVATDPAHRRLSFSMHWVNHRIDVAEVLVFGSQGPNGPWELVWLPITISQDENPLPCCVPGHNDLPWFETAVLSTTLPMGYPYYKLVLHARYPAPDRESGNVGVKITGVYFSSGLTNDGTSLSTPVVVYNPTIVPGDSTPEPTATPTDSGRPTQTPQPTSTQPEPTATPGRVPPGEPTSTPVDPTPTQRIRP